MLSRTGLAAAFGAYLWWGLAVLYFKLLGPVGGYEIVAHRVVQTVLVLGLLLTILGRWAGFLKLVRSWKAVAALTATTLLIGVNWLLYIEAVLANHVTEASLGYYINPLVSVLLGVAVLKERLNRLVWVAVGFAAAGVAVLVWPLGHVPWIALILAVTFGLYGLVRKQLGAEPMAALLLETLIMAPVSAWYLASHGGDLAGYDTGTLLLLSLAGIVTAVPLLLFAMGAARLPLYVMGVLQYVAPTVGLLIGVIGYGEAFGPWHWAGFGLIWCGLAIFTRALWKPVAVAQSTR